MLNPKLASIIADDIEAELAREPQPLVVLCGGEEQNQMLKGELSQRGIHAVSYGQTPADIEEALKEVADNGDPCTDLPEASGPVAILVTPQTLMQCFRSLNSKVIFLAVPLYFGNHLANALREMHLNGTGADRRLKIYDYVDRRIGLLDNYFRMRSYNYGVHPDVLLNASSK